MQGAFAKSYGYGGFFRANINDESLDLHKTLQPNYLTSRLLRSPEPKQSENTSLVYDIPKKITTPYEPKPIKLVKKDKIRAAVKMICEKMKKGSIPLSTGHKTSTLTKSTKASEFKTLLDTYSQGTVFNSQAIPSAKSIKASRNSTGNHSKEKIGSKNRYNPGHVKNKQTNIPFARLRQPNYIMYNRYGTTSAMLTQKSGMEKGAKLKRCLDERNKQNSLLRSNLNRSNYKLAYGQPLAETFPMADSNQTQEHSRLLNGTQSVKVFQKIFGDEAAAMLD